MKKSVIIMLLSLLVLCLLGCQKTPEDPVVINKNDGKLEEIIMATTKPDNTEVEQKDEVISNYTNIEWTEDYQIKNITYKFNLKPEAKEDCLYPVYKMKQTEFTTTEANKLVSSLITNATGVRDRWPTREELYTKLMSVRRGSYVVMDDYEGWESYEGQQEDIKKLEQEIQQTPEKEDFREIISIKKLPVDNVYLMEDGTRRYLTISDKRIRYSWFNMSYHIKQPERWVVEGAYPGEKRGTTLESVNIEKDDAIEIANAFLKELELQGFQVANAEKARILANYTYETKTEGWDICFLRTMNTGIPFFLEASQSSAFINFGEDYAESWGQEVIHVFVDATGIKHFTWDNPMSVVETLNENVEMLPFEKIQEQIKKTFKFGREAATFMDGKDWKLELYINRVVLSNMLVPIKNDYEHQMLMPVWIVYFDEQYSEDIHYAFAINAVDGSTVKLPI